MTPKGLQDPYKQKIIIIIKFEEEKPHSTDDRKNKRVKKVKTNFDKLKTC
jgi:hypothetical protein